MIHSQKRGEKYKVAIFKSLSSSTTSQDPSCLWLKVSKIKNKEKPVKETQKLIINNNRAHKTVQPCAKSTLTRCNEGKLKQSLHKKSAQEDKNKKKSN